MSPISMLPVREVLSPDEIVPEGWPFHLPPVVQLLRDGLPLGRATVLVGENGVGKSTLVEAIALAYGLSAEGGSTGAQHSSRPSESSLHDHLRLVRGAGAARAGYFLRAETLHGLLTYLEQNPPSQRETPFHELSHGQAFNDLVTERTAFLTRRGGLLVLDEPESGLSFVSQVALREQLGDLVDAGVQVLMATHSPVLASLPGARVLELDDRGMTETSWGELPMVQLYRRFLADPSHFAG